MRIAFISLYNTAPWGGSEDLWVKTAAYAAEQGHTVMASVFDFEENNSPKILELEKQGVILHFRKRLSSYKRPVQKIKLFIKNRIEILDDRYKDIFKFKPDVVFINDPGTFIYVRSYQDLHKKILENKIPYLIVCKLTPDYNSSISDYLREKAIEVFSNAKKILFVSERMRHNVERYLAFKLENSAVVQNPVNLSNIELLDFPEDEIINFGVVAHLGTAHKGQHILIDILSQKYWKEKKWILNLYGEGSDKNYLQKLAKFYNIYDRVVFHGYSNDIKKVWLKNHIMLHPSASEGMPKAVIEAMLCGRTVVATDVGGISEIIIDNETGFLAEAPSVNSFDKALRHAWNVKNEWNKIGQKAFRYIMNWIDKTPEKTLLDIIISSNNN